jgi:hypothetical protein
MPRTIKIPMLNTPSKGDVGDTFAARVMARLGPSRKFKAGLPHFLATLSPEPATMPTCEQQSSSTESRVEIAAVCSGANDIST